MSNFMHFQDYEEVLKNKSINEHVQYNIAYIMGQIKMKIDSTIDQRYAFFNKVVCTS